MTLTSRGPSQNWSPNVVGSLRPWAQKGHLHKELITKQRRQNRGEAAKHRPQLAAGEWSHRFWLRSRFFHRPANVTDEDESQTFSDSQC